MDAKITLVLGGARSGKSRHAESLVLAMPAVRRVYLATAEARDADMTARIARHRDQRGAGWATVEEPLEIAAAIRAADAPDAVILLECLTLWLNNLMEAGRDIAAETEALCALFGPLQGRLVLVSNEVGLGIVPMNELARAFADQAGRMNQRIAAAADRVQFVAAGLPMTLKG